jgi:hypothetical protein
MAFDIDLTNGFTERALDQPDATLPAGFEFRGSGKDCSVEAEIFVDEFIVKI